MSNACNMYNVTYLGWSCLKTFEQQNFVCF